MLLAYLVHPGAWLAGAGAAHVVDASTLEDAIQRGEPGAAAGTGAEPVSINAGKVDLSGVTIAS